MTSNLDELGAAGELAGALAKAQAAFPPIPRDKEVTVTTRSGGSYKFKYAPLDSILASVRKPLSDNGLAITQLLDGGDVVTMLLHEGGGSIVGRQSVGDVEGIQAFGSAVTYLRRYSIQSILGIAAEEDDDGNTAEGNAATFQAKPARVSGEKAAETDGLIGMATTQGTQDGQLRMAPDGFTLPFRVKDGDTSFIVLAENGLAETLDTLRSQWMGARVTVWGSWEDAEIPAKGNKPAIRYRVLHLERIATADWTLPAVEAPTKEIGL